MKPYEKLLLEMIEEKLRPIHIEHSIDPRPSTERRFKDIMISNLTNPIRQYTQGSRNINRGLWRVKNGNAKVEDNHRNIIDGIHKSLDDSPEIHEDMSVYSGIKENPQELVKGSRGILHHPAFLSSSMSPSVALGFAESVNTKLKDGTERGVKHVLKIHIRKGQKIGGYLGDSSQFPNEKEFLIKSNQVLHINPEYEEIHTKGYDGNAKYIVHVHHAIVMEPHEYKHLEKHPEIESHKKMTEMFKPKTTEIDNYLEKELGKDAYDDKDFVVNNVLEPHHIDKLIETPYLHEELAEHQTLEPHHIDKLIDTKDRYILSNLASQKNLKKHHIDKLLSHNLWDINENLLNNTKIKLDKSHIDSLLSNPQVDKSDIISRPELTKEHIDKLIDEGNNLDAISKRPNLSKEHIDKLLDKDEFGGIKDNIAEQENLEPHHIDRLLEGRFGHHIGISIANRENLEPRHIDKLLDAKLPSGDLHSILSYRTDLQPHHIDKLLDNIKNTYSFIKSDILRNINNNYNLTTHQVKKVENDETYNSDLLSHVVKKHNSTNNILHESAFKNILTYSLLKNK